MRVEEAVARLNLSDDRFVFFYDPPSGRGMVLYRRYVGHYGLLTQNLEEDTSGTASTGFRSTPFEATPVADRGYRRTHPPAQG